MLHRRPLLLRIAIFLPIPFLIVLTNLALARHGLTVIFCWSIYGVVFITSIVLISISDHRRQIRRHRADFSLCINCGYDIRGSAGVCPECAAPLPTSVDQPRELHETG